MGRHYNPRVVTANAVLIIDFANPSAVDVSTGNIFAYGANIVMTATNPSYINVANGFATYGRAATTNSTEKLTSGGLHASGNITNVEGIRYNEFYYNDHTFEVWFKIRDWNPSNYDANEQSSHLVGHRGYNIGYSYSSTKLTYNIWDTSASGFYIFDFLKNTEIVQDQWYQAVVTRSGTDYKKYINGEFSQSNTHAAPAINTGVANSTPLSIGAISGAANFIWHSNSSVAAVRMYNRALTDEEIYINFAATRGRFGI